MTPNSDDLVSRELNSDERLLWSGGPATGIRLRSSDLLMIPFSLLWGGFAFFWEYGVLQIPTRAHKPGGMPFEFMALWGIPFVLIGLYMIVGRFFADAYLRARTRYAVTDRRILIVTNGWSRQAKSLSLRTLGEVSLQERSDGSGTITFGSPSSGWGMPAGGWPSSRQKTAPAFEFVPDVRRVDELIRKAQSTAR